MRLLLTPILIAWALSAPVFAESSESDETPDAIQGIEPFPFPDPDSAGTPFSETDTELFLSAYNGDLAELEKLVASGADVNLRDQKKRTPLIMAAHNGHAAVVEFLIETGADVNARDSAGQTALLYTAKRSFIETAAVLLDNGADVNIQSSKKGVTALMIAAVAGSVEMVELLLDNGADPCLTDFFGRTAAFLAEKKGNTAVVAMLPDAPEKIGDG